MANKRLWLGMLVIALVLGMTVVGCDSLFPEEETEPEDDKPMGPEWTMVSNPPFGTDYIDDIAFGDGKFIAVGGSNKIAYSTDGANWSLVNNLPQIYVDYIAYGGGKWVTWGIGYVYYSTDGLSWTATTSTLSINSAKIAYGNGKFVVVGGSNEIAYSADGQTWETVSNPPFITDDKPDSINGIAFGDGKFIAVGGNKIANSTDGINWTPVSPALFGNNRIVCIAYGGGKFVASNDNATAYSTDGTNWTPITAKESGNTWSASLKSFKCIAFGNGKWIGINYNTHMGYSSDGINWTPAFNAPDITGPRGATYGNGKFVVIGSGGNNNGRIAYSAQ
jgi:hypothetical protein